MEGHELLKKIEKERMKNPNNIFIKWWRREEDFIDFDLLTRFMENLDYGTDIGGFELIDQEEMWRTIEARCNGRISRSVRGDGQFVVHYTPPEGAEVEEKVPEYPYTPEALVKILDIETDYNYVD